MSRHISEEVVREALRDRNAWAELTASFDDLVAVETMLSNLSTKVNASIQRRKSLLAAAHARLDLGEISSRDMSEIQRDYTEWKARAVGFRSIVDTHLREIRDRRLGLQVRSAKKRAGDYRTHLQSLALLIHAHEQGEASDEDLHECLDSIAMPFGIHGDLTLREAIARQLLLPHEKSAA